METNIQATPKFDYKTLSLKKQYVWKFCKQILRDIKNGECTDEQIDELVVGIETHKHGYFKEEDFVNSDQAMSILQLGNNRNLFFGLLKTYKVEAQTFKGKKIGYLRSDITRINNILNENIQRKRNRNLKNNKNSVSL